MHLHGVYEPAHRIAQGGQADVWRGTHRPTGLDVALKVVRASATDDEVRRLRDEARSAARLDHPAIVPVVDVGRLEARGDEPPELKALDGRVCVAMAWDDGAPLPRVVDTLDRAVAHRVVADVLDALAHIHARGLVHRDVKPANVLVDPSRTPVARLTDLGIGAALGRGVAAEGTPGFVDPVAVRTGRSDPAADLYAVGALACVVCAGVTPTGGHVDATIARMMIARGWPASAAAWAARAMAPEPSTRWRSAAEARRAWAECRPTAGRAAGQGGVATVGDDATRPVTVAHTPDARAAGDEVSPLPRPDVAPPAEPPRRRPAERRALLGAGAELLEARDVALIGHDAGAEALWRAVRGAIADRRPTVVAVDGPPGVGRSRVVRWCGESAVESTGARFVLARSSGALTRADVIEAARPWIATDPTAAADRDVQRWMSNDPAHDGFRDDAERAAVVARLVARWASERPVVIAFDAPRVDARWATAIRTEAGRHPVIVLTTATDPGGVDHTVALEPLADADVAAVVRHSVGVSNRVAEQVAARAAGRPRRALDGIAAHLAAGGFVARSAGLEPVDGPVAVAPTLRQAWEDRIENWSAAWDDSTVDAIVALLVLGGSLDDAMWQNALRVLGTDVPHAAVEALQSAHGVYDATGRLVADDLGAAWLDTLAPRRRRHIRRACAFALEADPRPRALVRRARHLVEAGRPAQAARALRALTDATVGSDEADAALVVLAAIARHRPLGPDDRALTARLRYVLGDADGALEVLGSDPGSKGSLRARVIAFDVLALVAMSRGQLDDARAYIEEMRALHGLRGALRFRADAAWGRWLIIARRGDEAIPVLDRAIASRSRHVPRRARLVARVLRIHALLQTGRHDEARRAIDRARVAAAAHGSAFIQAQIENDAAELDAARGDWATALQKWRRALAGSSQRFPAHAYLLANIAWASLHLGETDEARARLDDLAARFDPEAWTLVRLFVASLRIVAPAIEGREAAWDAAMAALDVGTEAVPGGGHIESAEAAEWAMRAWHGHGDAARAERARQRAVAWWARLRRDDRVEALQGDGPLDA